MAFRDVNAVVADNLRFHMERRGESQSSLARLSKVAQTTIGVYLDPERRKVSASGKLPSGKISELALLADALGIHVWELLIDVPAQSRQMIRDMIVLMTTTSDSTPTPPEPEPKRAASKKSPAREKLHQAKAVNH